MNQFQFPYEKITPQQAVDAIVPEIDSDTAQVARADSFPKWSFSENILLMRPAIEQMGSGRCQVDYVTTQVPKSYAKIAPYVEGAFMELHKPGGTSDAARLFYNANQVLSEAAKFSSGIPIEDVERARALLLCHEGMALISNPYFYNYDLAYKKFEDATFLSIKYGNLPALASAQLNKAKAVLGNSRVLGAYPIAAIPYSIEGRQIALFLGVDNQSIFDGTFVAALSGVGLKHPILLNYLWQQTRSAKDRLQSSTFDGKREWLSNWLSAVSHVSKIYLNPANSWK